VIEPIMYFGIGFLIASLVGLVFIPLVHSRAVRLTMRRVEASTPLSMSEIQADKDHLRAEFALATRRLEMALEQTNTRMAGQLAEIGRKTDAIGRLKLVVDEKAAAILSLESQEQMLREQVRVAEGEISAKIETLQERDNSLAKISEELANTVNELEGRTAISNSQRIELVTAQTQLQAIEQRMVETTHDLQQSQNELDRERQLMHETSQKFASARQQIANFQDQIAGLERTIIAQQTGAEQLVRRAQDLEGQVATHRKQIAEHDEHLAKALTKNEQARLTEEGLRNKLAKMEQRHSAEAEELRTHRQAAEEQLDRLRAERANLHKQIAAAKQASDAERTELLQKSASGQQVGDTAHAALRKQLAEAKQAVEAERAAFRQQLTEAKKAAEVERTALQKQLTEAKQAAGTTAPKPSAKAAPSADYADNALLRERINDVAAEVARLTMELEGPNSPIEAILAKESLAKESIARAGAKDAAKDKNGSGAVNGANEASLADRIRALQQRSARQRARV
jgi:chromosome segregation ATPase